MKYLLSALITTFAFGILMIAPLALAQTSDEDCAGTIGAGYGLCTAASHLGCGTDSEKNTNACSRIEENFVTITGELPPWLVQCDTTCPSLTNMESVVVPNSCQQSGVVLCEVTRCGFQGAGVVVGDQFWSDQDATYNGGQYTSFNDACR